MEEIDLLISVLNEMNKNNNYNNSKYDPKFSTFEIPQLNMNNLNNKINNEEIKNKLETEDKVTKQKFKSTINNINVNIKVLPNLYNIMSKKTNENFNNKIALPLLKEVKGKQNLQNLKNLKKLPKLNFEEEKCNNNNNYNYIPKMRYLDFRPYIDNINKKDIKDFGYYFLIMGADCPLVKNLLEDNGLLEISNINKDWTVLWASSIKSNIYPNIKKYQKVNHFPKNSELTRKDLLYKNLTKLQQLFPNLNKHLSFIPQSFIIPNELKYLQEEMEKDLNIVWIVKPVSSSQGRGIYVTQNIQEVKLFLNKDF